eukprot:scaffold141924_cov23-Tisochrysis_lutea.AAC.5
MGLIDYQVAPGHLQSLGGEEAASAICPCTRMTNHSHLRTVTLRTLAARSDCTLHHVGQMRTARMRADVRLCYGQGVAYTRAR